MEIKQTKLFFPSGRNIAKLMMRTFILLFCSTSFAFFSGDLLSQNTKISFAEDTSLTVDEVFDVIQQQTDYTFVYRANMFEGYPNVPIKKGSIRVNRLLQKCLSGGDLNMVVTKNNAILIKSEKDAEQESVVSGTVVDAYGNSLSDVAVVVKGTDLGTFTNKDGRYSINVPNPENVLVFLYLGAETQEIVVGSQTVIDVILQDAVNELNEVVINGGYYKTERATSTGNIEKVKASEIQKQPITNPIGTLQARMAGVEVRQNSAVPGNGFSIKIRGDNSIIPENGARPSNQPLYIVDGTPLNNVDKPANFVGDAILTSGGISPLEGINPNDIESIEVLKDADATAIYGSRGANGVVLITTKTGKAGKTVFDVNMYTGFTNLTRRKKYLNTQQHLEIRREAFANDEAFEIAEFGFPITEVTPGDYDVNGVFPEDRNTDWQEFFLGNTGTTNNIQLSASGGSERTQFRIGGGVSNDVPTLVGSDNNFTKISVQSSINHQSENGRFRIGLNTSYVSNEANYPSDNFNFQSEVRAPNADPLLDADGNLAFVDPDDENPLRSLFNEYNSISNTFLAGMNISYEILPSLTIKANVGYNKSDDEQQTTDKASLQNPNGFPGRNPLFSELLLNNSETTSWNFEPQLTWSQLIGAGELTALVGATWNRRNYTFNEVGGQGFADDVFINDINSAIEVNANTTETPYAYTAFFGRLGYNFRGKYIINVSGRRDGSSRFGANNRFSNFGSVGAAWVFSQESFLEDSSFLSFGKIRASYGTTGNDNIGDFQYLETFQSPFGFYSGIIPRTPGNLPNANFSWEGVDKFEVGLNVGFAKNRVNLDASYYQNKTTNQLIQRPLAATTGFSGIQINLPAVIQNKGFEFSLNTTNVQNDNFNWSTNFNITIPENELLEFPGLEENNSFRNRLVVGESINVFRAYEYNGLDPQTGLYTFTDFDGDGSVDFESIIDRQANINPDAQFFGGLTNSFSYKGIDLGFTFQFVKRTDRLQINGSQIDNAANTTDVLDRWQQPGDIATRQRVFTRFSNDFEARDADFFFSRSNGAFGDARSFIRLQNLSLGYTIPEKVLKGIRARLYFQGQNLLTFTKYTGWDPDSATPLYRTLTFGGQFTF